MGSLAYRRYFHEVEKLQIKDMRLSKQKEKEMK